MKTTFFKAIINSLFPVNCILCDKTVSPDTYLCKNCIGKIDVPVGIRCGGCGLNVKRCECNDFIYHFDGIVSPYFNKGYAQKGYYRFKFSKDMRAGEYYADKMAAVAKKAYDIGTFDFVTPVCDSNKNTDFDHTGILAEMLAERLSLKLVKALEPSDKKRSTQHELGLDKRFENVHNAYNVSAKCRGKNILLVDDIKTSGATIDECARQLKFAGAKKVCCVTALVGAGKISD